MRALFFFDSRRPATCRCRSLIKAIAIASAYKNVCEHKPVEMLLIPLRSHVGVYLYMCVRVCRRCHHRLVIGESVYFVSERERKRERERRGRRGRYSQMRDEKRGRRERKRNNDKYGQTDRQTDRRDNKILDVTS